MIYKTETKELSDHLCIVKGRDLALALHAILEELRSRIKYKHADDAKAQKLCEEIRAVVLEELEGYGINMDELLP